MAIKKLCARCKKIIECGKTYCNECQDRYDKQHKEYNRKRNREYNKYKRDKKKDKFYQTKEWKELRHAVKVRDYNLCQVCLSKDGKLKFADMVHHIKEIDEEPLRRLDKTNLICLCESCHQQIHREMRINDRKRKIIQDYLFKLIKDKHTGGI